MKPVDMREVLTEVGRAVNAYGLQVSKKCGIEFDDAKQELMIAAWQSAEHYHPKKETCERKKYVMADIYFRSLRIVDRKRKHDKVESRLLPKIYPLLPTVSEDHSNAIIERISTDQDLKSMSPELKDIIDLARQGYTRSWIGKKLGYTSRWVQHRLTVLHKMR